MPVNKNMPVNEKNSEEVLNETPDSKNEEKEYLDQYQKMYATPVPSLLKTGKEIDQRANKIAPG